jgi:hypothetical protein
MNAVQTVGRAKAAGLQRKEWAMLLVALGMVVLALLAPHVGDSPHQHDFADQRTLWGVPCALDVLSNLPFAFAGLWGLVRLRASRFAGQPPAWRATMALFFVGLVCTSVGSSVYHWQPDNAGLLWDRLGMAVAFAGMLGLAVTQRISERAGLLTATVALLAGPAAVVWWSHTGNVMPWAVVQLGGMLVVLGLAFVRAVPGMPVVSLGAVIAWYGAAKLAEAGDHAVFAATGQWVSGHTLKHLFAAGAAWPVLAALRAKRVNASVQQPATARR